MPQRLTHGSDVSTSSNNPVRRWLRRWPQSRCKTWTRRRRARPSGQTGAKHNLLPLHHLQKARIELECLQLTDTAVRAPQPSSNRCRQATAAGVLRAPKTQSSITDDAARNRSRSAERGLVQAAELPPDLEP